MRTDVQVRSVVARYTLDGACTVSYIPTYIYKKMSVCLSQKNTEGNKSIRP